MADLYQQAQEMYPRLAKDLGYKENFGGGNGYLEYYPEGEQRPFNDWAMISGYPGWLRGGAFDQWQNPERMYQPEQMNILKALVDYLKGAK